MASRATRPQPHAHIAADPRPSIRLSAMIFGCRGRGVICASCRTVARSSTGRSFAQLDPCRPSVAAAVRTSGAGHRERIHAASRWRSTPARPGRTLRARTVTRAVPRHDGAARDVPGWHAERNLRKWKFAHNSAAPLLRGLGSLRLLVPAGRLPALTNNAHLSADRRLVAGVVSCERERGQT